MDTTNTDSRLPDLRLSPEGSPTLGFHLKRLLKTFDGVRLGLCILDLLQTNTLTTISTIGFPKKSNP